MAIFLIFQYWFNLCFYSTKTGSEHQTMINYDWALIATRINMTYLNYKPRMKITILQLIFYRWITIFKLLGIILEIFGFIKTGKFVGIYFPGESKTIMQLIFNNFPL